MLCLTVSSKGPITPIEMIEKLELYECGPTVFYANAKDPHGVADVSHVVFPENTLAGSSSSFDQMFRYQVYLANPNEAADGGAAGFADLFEDADLGCAVFADDMYVAANRHHAIFADLYVVVLEGRVVLVNPHDVLDGGQVVLANPYEAVDGGHAVFSDLFGAHVPLVNLHGVAVARVVATLYGGANRVGDVLPNLYGAGAFRVVLTNLYGAADRSRVVFADPDGGANRIHGGAVNKGHARAPGYSFALANPDGALDGGRAVFADLYGVEDRVHGIAMYRGHTRALVDEVNNIDNGDD